MPTQKNTLDKESIIIYSVSDIRGLFHCGQRQAYALFHAPGFPSLQIGKRLYVEGAALRKWLECNKGKRIIR